MSIIFCTFAAAKVLCVNQKYEKMKKATDKTSKNHSGLWIMIVSAVMLEAISCIMYFSSRFAIEQEARVRAETELRNAELEIELHAVEVETAAKSLALTVQKHLNDPDKIYDDTRVAVLAINSHTSLAVAFLPDYYPKKGKYLEICSSRITEDSVYTRNIGSFAHDYTQMEWYQNGFVHDSCWWCEPYMDDSGSKTMVVSCSCPVYDPKGRVVAVICVDLSLDYLTTLSEHLKVYPNSISSIRSSQGEHIVTPQDTIAGCKYLSFREEIDATGWHIEIYIPEDELYKSLNKIGKIVGLLMILGLAVLGLIIWHTTYTVRQLMRSREQNQRMERELEIAQTIQMAMLPKVFPPFLDRLDLNIYGFVRPAKEVGGDLYDFYVRHDKLFFCVGDVSGKGVPAALVMAMIRSNFRSITAHEEQPNAIVHKMNKIFSEQNEQNMFATLFLGVLDLESGVLEYCNAGHNAPVLMADGEWKMIDVLPNLPLGIEPEFPYQAQRLQMRYNDMLFLYTDGLTEAENMEHQLFGEQRMMDALKSRTALRPRTIIDAMEKDVDKFVNGAEQSDDLTMLAFRYQTPAIVMRNDIQQIPTLAEWMDGLGVPDELNMSMNLALEEIVSNVMLYAYPQASGKVFVEFVKTTDQMIFTVSDDGVEFDPTRKPEVDITLSAEERQIGGLGIHLVRQIMDTITYERIDNKNILTLVKKL